MSSATSTLCRLPSDLESVGSYSVTPDVANNDPLDLRTKVVPDEQLVTLRSTGRVGRRLAAFYRAQNKRIRRITKPVDKQADEAQERGEAARLPVRIAVWASLVANVSLCILQLYAALSSRSLSLIATAVDSVFDILGNLTLFLIHKRAETLHARTWPAGGGRLETVGNVVYGSLMSAVNLVVVVESVHLLVEKYEEGKLMTLHIPSLVAVGAALGAKMLLFLYCLPLRRASSQVEMLWEDHRNDIFINGFGLLMSAGGSKLIWFLDPLGGAIIGCGVIATWTSTLYGLFKTLAGVTAPQKDIDVIMYQAATSKSVIRRFRSFKVYHNGQDYAVEIHAALSPQTPLIDAHSAAADLRHRLEKLPRVDSVLVVLEPDDEDAEKPRIAR